MKRVYYLFVLLLPLGLFAQSVGINASGAAPNASAMLDVNANNKGVLIPNVALTSTTDATTVPSPATSLLVYNTGTGGLSPAGYYYNAGSSVSPSWVSFTGGQNSYSFFTTAGATCSFNTAATFCPGFPQTVNIPAGSKVIVSADIGLQTGAGTTGWSCVDVFLVIDGAVPNDGVYQRLSPSNNGGLTGQFQIASFSQAFNLSPGNHTFGIAFASGFNNINNLNATVGGNGTSVLQGELTVSIIKN